MSGGGGNGWCKGPEARVAGFVQRTARRPLWLEPSDRSVVWTAIQRGDDSGSVPLLLGNSISFSEEGSGPTPASEGHCGR